MKFFRPQLLICVLGLFVFIYATHASALTFLGISSEPKTGAEMPTDLLGRETTNGCLLGFLKSVQLGKYQTAAQYLQLSPSERQSQGKQLSLKLQKILDHGLVGGLPDVTTHPEGTPQEGVPLDHERVGLVSVNGAVAKAMGAKHGITTHIDYQPNGDVEGNLKEIESELKEKWGLTDLLLLRRQGIVAVGEIISLVAVSSPGSEAAFAACRHEIACLKKMPTVNKTEIYS